MNQEYMEIMNQVYIGLDLHKYTHTAVAMDCFSKHLVTIEIENKPAEFDKLISDIKKQAGGRTTLIFGLEDVGGNGRSLAVYLRDKGYITKEVNAALAAGYRKGDAQYKKNDEHDAKCVAEVLVHKLESLPDADPQDMFWTLSQLVRRRKILVKMQTTTKNKLHEQLKHHYPSYNKFFSRIDGKTALYFWETYPSPMHLENITVEQLAEELRKASKNSVSTRKAEAILDKVTSDGKTTEGYQEQRDFIVKSFVSDLKHQQEEIKKAEEQMIKVESMIGYQLQTMPGISTVISCELIAEIGDINRFSNSGKLARFAGIAPVNFSSAGKGKDTKSKQGNRTLNAIFYNLAMQQVQIRNEVPRNPSFYTYYQKKQGEGKANKQALISIMRRLVNIIYGMMKSGYAYRMPLAEVVTLKAENDKVA